MKTLQKLILLSISAILAVTGLSAADFRPEIYSYTISSVSIGSSDDFIVSVTCNVTSPQTAVEQASANAIHGIIFKGMEASGNLPAQKPLVTADSLTSDQQTWFETFFRQKQYQQYIVSVARSSMRLGKNKKQYFVTISISVNKAGLRKCLERAGIIDRLGKTFEIN